MGRKARPRLRALREELVRRYPRLDDPDAAIYAGHGFDDADFADELDPALTTVRQPARDIGAAAIDALVGMMRDPNLPPPVILLPGELVVRYSCGAGIRA